jgi:hypothetical protein
MNQAFITAGIVCIIAAIIGGGLKAFAIEMPLVNSIGRQVILGVVGIIFLLLGIDWNVGEKKANKPTVDTVTSKDSALPSNEIAMQSMIVRARSDPQLTHHGGKTQIAVLIYKSDNTPIEGAKVKLHAGCGFFMNSGNEIELGTTNSQGKVVTKWIAPLYGAHPCAIDISANKEGFIDGKAHFSIDVDH